MDARSHSGCKAAYLCTKDAAAYSARKGLSILPMLSAVRCVADLDLSKKRKRCHTTTCRKGWDLPVGMCATQLRKSGFKVPMSYNRAVHDLRLWLLPSESRAHDSRTQSSRSTAPFQDMEASRSKPSVLEETRRIVSGKLRHFRAAQNITRHPLADVGVSVPPDLQAAMHGLYFP